MTNQSEINENTDLTENAIDWMKLLIRRLEKIKTIVKSGPVESATLDFDIDYASALSIRKREVAIFLVECITCINILSVLNDKNPISTDVLELVDVVIHDIYGVVISEKDKPLSDAALRFVAIKTAYLMSLLLPHIPDEHRPVLVNQNAVIKLSTLVDSEYYKGSPRNVISDDGHFERKVSEIERIGKEILAGMMSDAQAASAIRARCVNDEKLINDNVKKLKDVDSHFATANSKITDLLASASRVGLARSFALRRNKLEWANVGWVTVFLLGIAAMVYGTLLEHKLLPALIGPDGSLHMNAVLTRVLFAAPLVWLTWFAARQFGNNARLIEDYAFKESSALAYHGYKNEFLADQDHETLTVLRKVAAENFGANPTRMLSGQEAASPLHELLEGALKKEGFDKIVTVLNALNPKAKDDSAAKKDDKKDA